VNNIAGLLPILLLGVVFWAMLIRPQQRARAKARQMQGALSPGDEVSTVGGIYGIVRDIDDATVDIEVSEDVIVRFDRRAVSRIMRDVPAADADRYRIETGEHAAGEADDDAPHAAGEADDDAHHAAAEAPEATSDATADDSHEAADAPADDSHEAADAPGSTR
jgi:preprotein translocase subunit YajC